MHAEVIKQAGLLKDVTQRALVWRQPEAVLAVLPAVAVDLDKRLVGLLQAGNTTQQRGLARA